MKVIITFTFVAITSGKVSLWLWKSLENSGNFFLLLCGHPVISIIHRHLASGEGIVSLRVCHAVCVCLPH